MLGEILGVVRAGDRLGVTEIEDRKKHGLNDVDKQA